MVWDRRDDDDDPWGFSSKAADDDETTYALGRIPGRTYFSARFKEGNRRFAYRVWESEGDEARFEWVSKRTGVIPDKCPEQLVLTKEAVLAFAEDANPRYQIRVLFIEDTRRVEKVLIQRFARRSGKPCKDAIMLTAEQAKELLELFEAIKLVSLEDGGKRVASSILQELTADRAARLRALDENPELAEALLSDIEGSNRLVRLLGRDDVTGVVDLINESGLSQDVLQGIVSSGISSVDVVQLTHRRQQLETFRRLLSEPRFFNAIQERWERRRPEDVWQRFFERNTWILGHGLRYQFGTQVSDKLEVPVVGQSLTSSGKRVDGLLASLGAVRSLCYVEFKRHDTDLLTSRYRSGVYPPSRELVAAVSQLQATVHLAAGEITDQLSTYYNGEEVRAFNICPKAIVVVGHLNQLTHPDGRTIDASRVRSFELYRRNISNVEVLTFDELYERARSIVGPSESTPLF